ncbi:MAG: GGDEF domain-containing protein [Ectothiorhodospiraceae bacterium]|nr:GGDEF domain-containing protein [Ectothiorhodospiraceae bacterium]
MHPLADLKLPVPLKRAIGESHSSQNAVAHIGGAISILILLGMVAAVVHATGGTQTAYIHLAYLPILLGATLFGIIGGLAAAAIAGFGVAGPLMPMDVTAATPQPAASWLFRSGFFLLFGFVAGGVIGRLRHQLEHIRTASLIHPGSDLPTYLALEQFISELLRKESSTRRYGLILIDLKNFDQIFNTLGPDFMQRIPAAVAKRQRHAYPRAWQIYHVHSGKIAILVDEAKGASRDQAAEVMARLTRPVTIDNVPVYLDAIVGAASFSAPETSASAILQRANAALALARRNTSGLAAYGDVQTQDRARNIRLLADAPTAMDTNEFILLYQPQYRLSDHQIIGAEALIRWNHPTYGLVPPGQFIPLLEETALIHELTLWVARAAIKQAAEWQTAGLNLTVAINVFPRNLESRELSRFILQELANQRLGANRLELEVTESAIIDDPMALRDSLEALKDAGVSVALDDFGAGFTSVRHLTTLPIDKLKIDRSLVDRVTNDRRRMRIVSAVISMAKDLNLRTVAEGIEDAETTAHLKCDGCDIAQGFYFSKPLPAHQVAALLEPTRRTLQ